MIIKVCGMGDRDNILQLMEREIPDLMGLIFYEKSPRKIDGKATDPGFYQELPIPKVGVFVDEEIKQIVQKINDFGLDYVQLHGSESAEFITKLKRQSSVKIIKVFRIGTKVDWQELKPFEALVDIFLFDTHTKKFGGSGIKFDWAVLEEYPLQKGFLLSGGVDEKSVETIEALALKMPKLLGVDINSRFETAPGRKNIDKVRKFIKKIRDKID